MQSEIKQNVTKLQKKFISTKVEGFVDFTCFFFNGTGLMQFWFLFVDGCCQFFLFVFIHFGRTSGFFFLLNFLSLFEPLLDDLLGIKPVSQMYWCW